MSLDRLGVFGDFGMTRAVSDDVPPCLRAAPQPALTRNVHSEVIDLFDPASVGNVYMLGHWDLEHIGVAPEMALSEGLSTPDLLLQLDNWAWAAHSFDVIACARITLTLVDTLGGESISRGSRPDAALLTSTLLADLTDPRPLIRSLKLAALNGSSAWVMHHPDWPSQKSFECLQDWLRQHGFAVAKHPLSQGFHVLQCTLTSVDYASFLRKSGVDPAMLTVDKLLVTTEDADVQPTGGIGTYVKNVRALNASVGTLLCHLHATQSSMPARTICPQPFVGHMTEESYFDGLGLIDTVQSLLCLLPSVTSLEIQDYRSIGYRLVQGKRTGRLPQWLHLSVILHGSVDYVKFGIGDDTAVNYGIHELKYAVKDAYIFENVDECVAPSRYLAQRLLSDEFGYHLNNLRYVRLPFDHSLIPTAGGSSHEKVSRLVYVGKYNRLKGWDDFVEAVETLAQRGALSDIKEIVSLAPTAPSREHRARLANIASYRSLHLSHTEMLTFLAKHRHDTLIVIPSRGENYPFVVLEQLLVGTLFVAYAAGGAPEVVGDTEFVKQFFCDPNPESLAKKISDVLRTNYADYSETLQCMNLSAIERQVSINAGWSKPLPKVELSDSTSVTSKAFSTMRDIGIQSFPKSADLRVAVAVPVYRTALTLVAELLASVLRSKLIPTTVLLIDDGNDTEYCQALKDLAIQQLDGKVQWQIHSQKNVGLAGARNAALGVLEEPYIFFLDSDDCLLPHTLHDALAALLLDNKQVAVTGFAIYLRDTDALSDAPRERSLREGDFWKPLGCEKARALSLFENQYLTANAMIRASAYRSLGGWDESDRSMWEDWALYSRLAWTGHKFSLIPVAGYMYRISTGSMSKTYSRYDARRRLIRNLPFASKLDANVIFSLVNGAGSERSLLRGAALSEREAELIQFVRSMLNKPRLKAWILRLYGIYSSLRRRA